MDWLTEGTTWEVVLEWRRRFPGYSDLKVTTQDMRAVLAGTKIIARYKKGFVVTTKEELDQRNAEVAKINAEIRRRNREAREEARKDHPELFRILDDLKLGRH